MLTINPKILFGSKPILSYDPLLSSFESRGPFPYCAPNPLSARLTKSQTEMVYATSDRGDNTNKKGSFILKTYRI